MNWKTNSKSNTMAYSSFCPISCFHVYEFNSVCYEINRCLSN